MYEAVHLNRKLNHKIPPLWKIHNKHKAILVMIIANYGLTYSEFRDIIKT